MTLLRIWQIRLRRSIVNALFSVIIWSSGFGRGGPSARRTAMWLGSVAREQADYKDWYNAIRLSKMAVEVDPGCPEAYLMLGYAYMRVGDVARAREALTEKGVEALTRGRTSFIIAHRLSTIKRADRIMVVENGHVEEVGSHADLLRQRGKYYRLYAAQFRYGLEQKYGISDELCS